MKKLKPDIKPKKLKPVTVFLPKALPSPETLVSGTNLSPDRLRVYMHQVMLGRLKAGKYSGTHNSWIYEQGWSPLHSKLLTQLVSNKYSKYAGLLEADGYIERRLDNITGRLKYTGGKFSQMVRPGAKLNGQSAGLKSYRIETVTDPKTLKAVYNTKNKYKNVNGEKGIPLEDIHRKLHEMEKNVRFDLEAVEGYLGALHVAETEVTKRTMYSENMMITEAYNLGMVDYCKVDAFGRRLHTPLKTILGGLHQFIYFRGFEEEETVSLDFANSQLFFTGSILVKPGMITRLIPEFEPCIEVLQRYSCEPDVQRFYEKSQLGLIYEEFMNLFAGDYKTRRDASKESMIGFLYSKVLPEHLERARTDAFRRRFQAEYPNVVAAITAVKGMGEVQLPFMKPFYTDKGGRYVGDKSSYKNLSAMMQLVESGFVLGDISKKLVDCGLIPFYTVHDSLVVLKRNMTATEAIIRECFQRHGLLPPKVKCELQWKGRNIEKC